MSDHEVIRIERDTYRAVLARLLVAAENYTRNHDLHGGSAIITGRCWDKLRRAMDEAAQTLEVLETTPWLGNDAGYEGCFDMPLYDPELNEKEGE